MINGVHPELGLLDEGSEIVVIREDIWKKTKAPINKEAPMRMQTANGGSQEMAGCVEMLEIEVEGIKTWAHAYVVPDAPYRLLLGRPWQRLVRLSKVEDTNGVSISIYDPMNPSRTQTVATTPRLRPHPSLALTATTSSTSPSHLHQHPRQLPESMDDTDNAKSKCEFKKVISDRFTKEEGCTIESLEAPDFK
jgi:hypothetical protein